MTLHVDWTKNLRGDSKAEFGKVVENSTLVLRRLKELIAEYEAELNRQETRLEDYDTTSWAAKQAHRNGMRHAYKRLSDLLSFLKE